MIWIRDKSDFKSLKKGMEEWRNKTKILFFFFLWTNLKTVLTHIQTHRNRMFIFLGFFFSFSSLVSFWVICFTLKFLSYQLFDLGAEIVLHMRWNVTMISLLSFLASSFIYSNVIWTITCWIHLFIKLHRIQKKKKI